MRPDKHIQANDPDWKNLQGRYYKQYVPLPYSSRDSGASITLVRDIVHVLLPPGSLKWTKSHWRRPKKIVTSWLLLLTPVIYILWSLPNVINQTIDYPHLIRTLRNGTIRDIHNTITSHYFKFPFTRMISIHQKLFSFTRKLRFNPKTSLFFIKSENKVLTWKSLFFDVKTS